jgi:hypothetical protein
MLRVALMGAAMALCAPAAAPAQQSTQVGAAEAALRIDVAGRQPMLAQRMAKAACLAARGIDRDDAMAELRDAYEAFAAAHAALRDGDPAMRLGPERVETVRAALDRTDPAWSVARMIVSTSLAGAEVDAATLPMLDRAAQALLDGMEEAVGLAAVAYADGAADTPLALTVTLNLAGRQRMLSQRIVKEACLMGTGDDEARRARLSEAVALFDASLDALRTGMPEAGIMPPPSQEIEFRLAWVAQLWGGLRSDLRALTLSEGPVAAETLSALSERSELVLSEMDETVRLYGG